MKPFCANENWCYPCQTITVLEVPARITRIIYNDEVMTLQDGISKADNGEVILVDNSLLELWSVCEYKTYLSRFLDLTSPFPPAPAEFGSCIHSGMAAYYRFDRKLFPVGECAKTLQIILRNMRDPVALVQVHHDHTEHIRACKRCCSIFTFIDRAHQQDCPIPGIEPGKFRSLEDGVEILMAYADFYGSKDFAPISNDHIEVGFAVDIGDNIIFCGKIDMIIRDQTGLVVVDHKTSWSLAEKWAWSLNPNHQFTGYAYCTSITMGEPVNKVIINGIQTSGKTRNFSRPEVSRNIHHYQRWKDTVKYRVEQMKAAVEKNFFDPAMGVACTRFNSKCQFMDVCLSPGREKSALESYHVQPWAPYGTPMIEALKRKLKG